MIMIFLGLLLLAATAAFTGLAVADNISGGPHDNITILGHQIANMSSLDVFLSGIALALVFCLGLALATGGGARMHRRAAALGAARAEARRAIADRDALQERLNDSPGTGSESTDPAPVRRSHRRRQLFGH
ncbi:hypothetical protein [Streptacidiphilus sp. P02-A3a]|uniref:hypothetical protein n=1 Tax=Streptacidiphilus sp. P02-A3a TaxID=2704468 RepID=UPI0015FA4033|nr:hypothetical protein [Streptacidiphilus sp. P02-A3a]